MIATQTPQMPTFTTSTAMSLLWNKASRQMHPHELEWIASGATEHIALVAYSLTEVLSGLGCLIGSDESSGSLSSKDDVSQLMYNLGHQIDTIRGLAVIADDAGHLAMQALKETKA